MRSGDITKALDVGKKWTRQIKSEEKAPSARRYRSEMWMPTRTSLKDICFKHMQEAWNKASDNGRLPTHWRQIFYVMRPICDGHPESDRPLTDTRFKSILEDYLDFPGAGWDVLRGARGVFKEPHAVEDDNGLPMSTMNVRNYLSTPLPSATIKPVPQRFPTKGATHRIATVLICEKEGFDELLEAERIPERFDLALMSTKGVSAYAARDLAQSLGVPCFTLHDLDKNGFVMAGGFPFATDLGIRMEDVEKWGLTSEEQIHTSPQKTRRNVIKNGGTQEEADFIAGGERVELNMFTSSELVEYVTWKLEEHGVEKVIPDEETLRLAWRRAHIGRHVNAFIARLELGDSEASSEDGDPTRFLQDDVPELPKDLADRIRGEFEDDDTQSWDEALWSTAGDDDAKAGS